MAYKAVSRQQVLMIIGVLVLAVGVSSCDTLAKKFRRQKKKTSMESMDFIPVLDPQEYPAPQNDPVRNYNQHYALIKIWYKDLWSMLEDNPTEKHQQYILKQVFDHIDQMQQLVDEPTQAELTRLGNLLAYYKESVGVAPMMRNTSRIQSDLRAFDRLLRDKLRADKVEGHFVTAIP